MPVPQRADQLIDDLDRDLDALIAAGVGSDEVALPQPRMNIRIGMLPTVAPQSRRLQCRKRNARAVTLSSDPPARW